MSANPQRRIRAFTGCLSSGLLTATGAETVYDTTVTVEQSIGGKFGTALSAVTDGATPTTDANTGEAFPLLVGNARTGQGAVVVWGLNSSGTVSCRMGPVAELDSAGSFLVPPQFPYIPDTIAPFAYQVLKHYAQASSVRFGTSNWNTSGFTNAIVNVMQLPDRPQVS